MSIIPSGIGLPCLIESIIIFSLFGKMAIESSIILGRQELYWYEC